MLDRNEKSLRVQERTQNASRIFLISFFITLVIGIYFSLVAAERGAPIRYGDSNVQAFFVAFASILSFMLLRQKQLVMSVLLFLGVFSIGIIASSLYFGGMDIILALIILLTYLGVGGATLPRSLFEGLMSFSVFLSVVIGFVGYWDPLEREYLPPDPVIYVFAALLIIIYSVFLWRQYQRYSLRTKLVIFFVILSASGIGVAFTIANFNLERVLFANSQQRLLAEAESSGDNVDSYLLYGKDSLETASAYLDLRAYLLQDAQTRNSTPTGRQAQNLLYALKNRSPEILSYGLLDIDGNVVLDSRTDNIGTSEAHLPHFIVALQESNTYVSSVLYLPGEKSGVFFISTPVYTDMGLQIGIIRAKYNASVLERLIIRESVEHEMQLASNAYYALFDENSVLLAHELGEERIGKVPGTLNPAEFETLQTQYLIPGDERIETISLNFPDLANALFADIPFFEGEDLGEETQIIGAIIGLDNAPWKIVAFQSQDEFVLPARRQGQIFFLLAMGTVLFAIMAGTGISNVITAPIIRLRTVAQRFTEGDLAAHAVVETDDEIGELADTFNTLAVRLNETVASLEDRVQERTRTIEDRTRYLEGAAEIGRLATTIIDADELSKTVVELIRERFNLYYVGLFMADSDQEWAILRAGTGVAGEIMLSNNHRLKIGEGMIGWTVRYGEARIALDVGEDAVRFENPVLPETRSEGALPLRSRGRILGAISVQSKQPAAFDLEILTTLQTMADQIAVAFDNAELFRRSEEALEAERRAYGELTLKSWQDMKKRSSFSAFRVDKDGGIKALKPNDVETRQQSLGEYQALQEDGRAVVLPIKSRGHVIGGIRIAKSGERGKWTKEQLQLVDTISEQLSVALESARLFEDTQLRAQREAVISDISSKVGASIRTDTILKTTVEELGKALSGADISFEITGPQQGAKPKR